MYSTADYSITPRPMYPADGRKVFDIYTHPFSIRTEIKNELGEFPFPAFWGPAAGTSGKFQPDQVSRWIADSAKWIENKYQPTLSLIYLPHLDYNLQRVGPSDAAAAVDVQQVDELCGDLIAFYEARGVQVVILSEYGLCDVTTPVHINRVLREHRLIAVREERGLEVLDPGASAAFAVADHQVAHIYVNDPSRHHEVRALLEKTPGI
jgi:predicted AlkP superfamily pyrophosphatase or phosphodiesterase